MAQPDYVGLILPVLTNVLWLLAPALLVVVSLRAWMPSLLGHAGEARVRQALQRLLPEVANDLILPDGRSGLTQIDHLALTSKGLLVVETKNYRGSILGKEREPSWTQVLGRSRHSFQNPLRQNHAHIRAVELQGLTVPVFGLVVFAGSARFPRGMPPGVCSLCDLGDELAPYRQDTVPAAFRTAWERVLASARTNRHAKQEHLRVLRDRHGTARMPRTSALLLLLAAVAWVGVGWWLLRPAVRPAGQLTSTAQPIADLGLPVPTSPGSPPAFPTSTHTFVPLRGPRTPPVIEGGARQQAASRERGTMIEWAGPTQPDDACSLAIAAVLIDNTTENQRTRDRACRKPARTQRQ